MFFPTATPAPQSEEAVPAAQQESRVKYLMLMALCAVCYLGSTIKRTFSNGLLMGFVVTSSVLLLVALRSMNFAQLTRLLTPDGRRCVHVHDEFAAHSERGEPYDRFVMHLGEMAGADAGSHMHGCKIHEGKSPAAFTVLENGDDVRTYKLDGDRYRSEA